MHIANLKRQAVNDAFTAIDNEMIAQRAAFDVVNGTHCQDPAVIAHYRAILSAATARFRALLATLDSALKAVLESE